MRDCSHVERSFENILGEPFDCASDRTDHLPKGGYNCVAYALGKKDDWWWPTPYAADGFWPKDLPRDETVEVIAKAFENANFIPCNDGVPEKGFEKVAIYDDDGEPTHVARLIPDGRWVSKLGDGEDIVHRSVHSLEGAAFGKASTFLKRENPDFL